LLALEERGFESHSHIPLSRKTPFPGGGDLPKQYYDAMDPFVMLAAASQVTKTIKLGPGVLLVQQRDAIQTAKLVASIDQVSQGRFLFGVGGGWNQDEMENHGTVYATRFKRMRESIEAMKEIWTKSGRMPWGVRPFRSDDRPAQTGAETAPAYLCRRRLPAWRAARDPLWRWLDPNRRARRYRRSPAEIPRDGAGVWTRSSFHRNQLVRSLQSRGSPAWQRRTRPRMPHVV
jgi:alkanesulfonate monooxygenase SsuD/methylene tetrahydromethanopterin reductase-like flavin-dependent oxidoreductase (luciferase family)